MEENETELVLPKPKRILLYANSIILGAMIFVLTILLFVPVNIPIKNQRVIVKNTNKTEYHLVLGKHLRNQIKNKKPVYFKDSNSELAQIDIGHQILDDNLLNIKPSNGLELLQSKESVIIGDSVYVTLYLHYKSAFHLLIE
jgi:hypothetical protein